MKTIKNFTPHPINIILETETITITPEPTPARVSQIRKQVSTLNGIPVNKNAYGKVENLPAPKENVVYIVSMMVAGALPNRKDLFIPDDIVRDEKGRIIGARGLAQV